MKKRMAVILSLLLCLLPMSALADSTGSTEVSYTHENAASTYEINIPSLVYLQSDDSISLTVQSLNLKAGEKVVAYVDGSQSFSSGKLSMTNDKGDKINASVYRLTTANAQMPISPTGETYFTEFTETKRTGDKLQIVPSVAADTPSGTYTATVHFILKIESA